MGNRDKSETGNTPVLSFSKRPISGQNRNSNIVLSKLWKKIYLLLTTEEDVFIEFQNRTVHREHKTAVSLVSAKQYSAARFLIILNVCFAVEVRGNGQYVT